ncbi:hypothetical protein D3C76_936330 [compost metagenome]
MKRCLIAAIPSDRSRWCGTRERFGKLPHTPFDQQATGQLDQVHGGDVPHPVALTLLRQPPGPTLGQGTVVTGHITFNQLAHFRGLRLPEGVDGLRRVQPSEKQIADAVFARLYRELIRAEKPRALTVHRGDLIGQQTQVILSIGITDAVTEPTLVLGANMRHTKAGPADIGTGVLKLTARIRRKTQPQKHTRQAQPGQLAGNNHIRS